MTSYSTYMTGRLRLVDGDLTHEGDEERDEQLQQVKDCIGSGAMRALLDQARDLSDDSAVVDATQWHSADEGWELRALTDSDQPEFLDVVSRFVEANLTDIIQLVNRIAWGPRWTASDWSGDQGMAFYRVGYLLGMEGAGQGIGFRDYAEHAPYVEGVPERTYAVIATCHVTDRLSAWLDTVRGGYPFEGAYVDGTEEPCLLHLGS